MSARVCDVLRFNVSNSGRVLESYNTNLDAATFTTIFLTEKGLRSEVDYPALCDELESAGWEPVCERPVFMADNRTSSYFVATFKRHISPEHKHPAIRELARQAAELVIEIGKEEVASGFVGL